MFTNGWIRTLGAAALTAGIMIGGGFAQAQEENWSEVEASAKARSGFPASPANAT